MSKGSEGIKTMEEGQEGSESNSKAWLLSLESGRIMHTESAPLINTMISGAFAGGLADTVMHPFDTVKTRLQAQVRAPFLYTGMLHAFKTIIQREGIRGLYGGLGATMYSAIPSTAIYFVVYERTKAFLLANVRPDFHSLVYFSSGAAGEAVASLISVPLEVIKQRMQLKGLQSDNPAYTSKYKHTIHALLSILRKDGIRGVYIGYGATIMRDVPFSAVQFAVYEQINRVMQWRRGSGRSSQPSTPEAIFMGGVAGGIAAASTAPLDLVKTRLQIQGEALGVPQYTGIRHAFMSIAKQEGFRGLWKGIAPRVVWVAPQSALMFSGYEFMKSVFALRLSQ